MVDIDVINQYEYREKAEPGTIVLNGVAIPATSVTTSYTSRFETKLTLGDYSKDSDQLQSTWIQSNWAGGMLIDHHIEGATEQRGRWAKAWTMSAEQLSLPPKLETVQFGPTIDADDVDAQGPISMPLIEIRGILYVAMGKELWTISADLYAYDNVVVEKVADLPGYAQGEAVLGETDGVFYIPLGSNGVCTVHSHANPVTPNTVVATEAGIAAMALVRWDTKIMALEYSGQVRIFQVIGGTWDAADPNLMLPPSDSPRGMEVFYNNSGDPTVFVVSDRGLFAIDYEIPKLYASSLRWPKHHNTGMGLTAWRDDALYIASGFAVTRYTRDGVRTDIGLDRDDGIPADVVQSPWGDVNATYHPGRAITAMVGTQNFIAALVQLGGPADTIGDYPYALCVWNEGGWHVLVEDVLPYFPEVMSGRYPTGLFVTENVGGYRVWWGEGGSSLGAAPVESGYIGVPRLHSIGIPRSFHGPRQKVMDNIDAFAPTGYYETGWFDAGMRGFEKTWSHLEVTLADPGTGLPLDGTVEVRYRTEDNPTVWNVLGTATGYGRTILTFGEDERGFPVGATSTAIDLRFNFSTSVATQSPIMDSFVLKFIKLSLPGRSWMTNADIGTEQFGGIGPKEMSIILARQTYQGGFSRLIEGTEEFRVRVSQVQHFGGTGTDFRRSIGLNIIEVPIPGHPVWGGDV